MITLTTATENALRGLKDHLHDHPDDDMEAAIGALATKAIPHTVSELFSFVEATAEECVRKELARHWRLQRRRCEKVA